MKIMVRKSLKKSAPTSTLLWIGLGFSLLLTVCSQQTSFDSGVRKEATVGRDIDVLENRKLGDPIIDFASDSDFTGGYDTVRLRNTSDQRFWVGVVDYSSGSVKGKAFHYKISDGSVIEKKTWTGLASPGAGGTRIFVLEGGGAVLAKQGGLVYFLHDSFAEGDISSMNGISYKLPNATESDRACAVAYLKNGKKIIGIGYGQGWFIEIPQNDTAPYAPNFDNVGEPVKVHEKPWGYSCFIDSRRLIYYGQFTNGRYGVQAVSLQNLTSLDPESVAPNAKFRSETVPEITSSVNLLGNSPSGKRLPGSYAMAGDLQGNIYNGMNYTVTHEPYSNTLWATDQSGSSIRVYPHKCGSVEKNCVGHKSFSTQDLGISQAIRPISALGGGYVIGLTRISGDQQRQAMVYLLSLKDPEDISKGVNVQLLDTLQRADPYMYTDFTGSTLYKSSTLNEIDLSQSPSWKDGQIVNGMSFIYTTDSNEEISWDNIKSEIRCYLSKDKKPEFEELDFAVQPLVQKKIEPDSCNGKNIKFAEVRFTAKGSTPDLNYISEIQITAFQ